MPDNSNENKQKRRMSYVGLGIVLGSSFGLIAGLLLDNIGLGLALGAAIGVVIGSIADAQAQKE